MLGKPEDILCRRTAAVYEDHRRRRCVERRSYREDRPALVRSAVGVVLVFRHASNPLRGGSLGERHRRQPSLDVLALRLEPGRQLETGAKLAEVFIGHEPRAVGRNLEQHAAGLSEIDRAKVLPVEHSGDIQAGLGYGLPPFELLLFISGPKSHVMDCPAAYAALRQWIGLAREVNDRRRSPGG